MKPKKCVCGYDLDAEGNCAADCDLNTFGEEYFNYYD